MQIVPRIARLFAARAREDTHICLVRTLVGAEPRIAIDTVSGVLEGESRHRGIERRHGGDITLSEVVEATLGLDIAVAMRFEPVAVVIARQIVEEFDYGFHTIGSLIQTTKL